MLFANSRAQWIFCLVYALGFGTSVGATLGVFNAGTLSIGSIVIIYPVAFIWGMPMYFLLVLLLLPLQLGECEYKLFQADPASTKIISQLSQLLTGLVYLYAAVAGGSMVYLARAGLLKDIALPAILVSWLPIAALFILSQNALGSIIRRGKWETLSEIQMQVEKIEVQGYLADKDTMDKINRLMDFHDRVKNSRSSSFDIRAGLNFLNSLLFPVIGFILGNWEWVQKGLDAIF